jgi:hypothetical protein
MDMQGCMKKCRLYFSTFALLLYFHHWGFNLFKKLIIHGGKVETQSLKTAKIE